MEQFLGAIGRPVHIVNLDPANESTPYTSSITLTDLISVGDVMEELGLGPNGAMLYCMEYLEANIEWLETRLDALEHNYVVFDLPGQVELTTNHPSLKRIIEHLCRRQDWRFVAVHLTDATHITDPSRYISLVLLALRAMLMLELPHVNVLSKFDQLDDAQQEQLAFNIDYYTEVQDLSYLQPELEAAAPRFGALSRAIGELIEDFGLVSFETLAVEDKASMLNLLGVLDRAVGYALVVALLLVALGVSAQDDSASVQDDGATELLMQSIIPADASDACKSLLLQIDQDEMFRACTEPLIQAAGLYANASQDTDVNSTRSALQSTLDDVCISNGGCERSLVRQYVSSFWDSCSDELESGNSEVKDLYDYIYMFVPFRDAVCSQDNGQYCVLGLVPQNLQAIKQLQASRGMYMNLATSSSSTNTSSSSVLVEQAFLFLGQASNETVMCSNCAQEVLSSYVAFEMSTPYALGLDRSEVLGKQSEIVSHAQDLCGEKFIAQVGSRAGSRVYTEAALRAGAAALRPSILLFVAVALAAAFV
ncbi:hypothetical protein MCUN1_003428 [Malassezia cuniculi]|uniref:ATP-binding domain 1 family member B homolog n=1 Tax=Malassezia cuniculi TaxID=948313 RepID=A0AAF0EWZ6_9BASI|nr:hypothetical protein MCUN1_003428 [Malassezia cuniculi]